MRNETLRHKKLARNRQRRAKKRKAERIRMEAIDIMKRQKRRAELAQISSPWTKAMADKHSSMVLNNSLAKFSFKEFFKRSKEDRKKTPSWLSKVMSREKKDVEDIKEEGIPTGEAPKHDGGNEAAGVREHSEDQGS